jgi:hypothetical protein
MDTQSPGMEMGQLGRKLGWKGKYMDSSTLSCETVEKGWSSADFPPMKKLPTKVISATKTI